MPRTFSPCPPSFPLHLPTPPLPAACLPWATWPCSGSSASSSRAWVRGLCCCNTSCSTTGGVGGLAEARGKSPGMGRSGFTRSGICGLMLGGCQFPSAILDSSPCRREAENQPMMWASDPHLSLTPTSHPSLGSPGPSSAPQTPCRRPLHLTFLILGAFPQASRCLRFFSSLLKDWLIREALWPLSKVIYPHPLPLSSIVPLSCFICPLSGPDTYLFPLAPLVCYSRRGATLFTHCYVHVPRTVLGRWHARKLLIE